MTAPCLLCGEQVTEDQHLGAGGCTFCAGDHVMLVPCPACEGNGEIHNPCMGYPHITCREYTCPLCKEEGEVSAEEAARWEASDE